MRPRLRTINSNSMRIYDTNAETPILSAVATPARQRQSRARLCGTDGVLPHQNRL